MDASAKSTSGLLLVISGPSGVGKTTIARHVERELGGVFSVSMTTRPKTDKDTEGVDYTFVDPAEFERQRDAGELLEWARVFENYYGTPRRPVIEALERGELIILEIDVEGAVQVKHHLPEAFAIFIEPPNEQALLERLRSRQREDESVIQRRFAKARLEIERARSSNAYDRFIVNDDLSEAMGRATELVTSRRHIASDSK